MNGFGGRKIDEVKAAMKRVLQDRGRPMYLDEFRDEVIEHLDLQPNRETRDQIEALVRRFLDGVVFKMNDEGKIDLAE